MRSERRGANTLAAEVANISADGFWLLVDKRELFLPFKQFPWFRAATVAQILNVQRPHKDHLHWPDLDVDLALDSIEHPENYPLVSKAQSNIALRRMDLTARSPRSLRSEQRARRPAAKRAR
ncbi:MAG: DUF2442 domain-containing protein [bacterium]